VRCRRRGCDPDCLDPRIHAMTPSEPSAPDRRRPLRLATLAVAAVLVVLSVMVMVPPFRLVLFPLAVGASEYSPVLVLLDLLWCLPVNRLLRPMPRLRYASLVALLVSACVAVRPLTQYTRVAAAASEQLGTPDLPPRFSLVAAFGGLPTSAEVTERLVPYAAPDGQRLTLQLFSLPKRETRPTVVVLYGGAWRQGTASQAANVSRALASKGYVVAALDYRHAPLSPYPAQTDDVSRGILLLRDSADAWGIDLARMAILGRSSGGHLAELAAYMPGGYPFRAVIAIYAPYDLVKGYADLPSPDPLDVRTVLRTFLQGSPQERPVQYHAASPASYVRPGLPPTLLIFGGRDHVVKPEFNRMAARALRAARVPVVEVELPWAEHAFDLAPAGIGGQLAFNVISDFLSVQLKPAHVGAVAARW
jgi:acetyl esterase/lipase